MHLVKTLIIEDEIEQANKLASFLNQYGLETGKSLFDIKIYTSPVEFIETFKYDADLIFLDIRMPGMNGMQVAKEIRLKDEMVTLVFITSLTQYALEGYSVSAEDYIVKPINYPEFKLKLNRAIPRVTMRKSKIISFINNDNIIKIPLDSILYIETNLHKLIFHDNEGFTYVRHQSMKECEEELKGTDFFRINSSYLVNFRYATSIKDGNMFLSDGTALKISRPRQSEVVKYFKEFMK